MKSEVNGPKIAIVGGGFGGLRVAKKLSKAQADISLFDQNNYHLFQPLLYQVGAAYLNAEDIAISIGRV